MPHHMGFAKKLYKIKKKEKETITRAKMAKGRFTPAGSVSFFIIKMSDKEKDSIKNVTIDPALLMLITSGVHISPRQRIFPLESL